MSLNTRGHRKVNVVLPSSLQELTFGADFDQSMVEVELPKGLRSLTFGAEFNQILKGTKSLGVEVGSDLGSLWELECKTWPH